MRPLRLTNPDAPSPNGQRRQRAAGGVAFRGTHRTHRTHRRGAAAVEAAIVFPVLFLCLFALVIGGLGVFRYFQVDCLARESARYLSVRGKNYATYAKTASPTEQQTINQVVMPMAAGMNATLLTVQIDWIDRRTDTATDWDSATKSVTSYTANGSPVTNHVRVTVSYKWFPEAYLAGPYYLRSVTEVPMSF
jgi:Flp pilus assembly protein TadG